MKISDTPPPGSVMVLALLNVFIGDMISGSTLSTFARDTRSRGVLNIPGSRDAIQKDWEVGLCPQVQQGQL